MCYDIVNHTGASAGLVVLIVTITYAYLIQQRRKLKHIKQRYFQQHGGMLLFEEIKSQQGIAFRIFSEAELQEATDEFNEKQVLGHGGHGTVYKGLLKGNVEVAVKRCMSIDEQHKKEFGKEMFILSQINHRNIVKLLGCCLEVQVPMLVYEFIPMAHCSNSSMATMGGTFPWLLAYKSPTSLLRLLPTCTHGHPHQSSMEMSSLQTSS
jgi:hypothetical protein